MLKKSALLCVLAAISLSKAISQQVAPQQPYNYQPNYINRGYSVPPADDKFISDQNLIGSPYLLNQWTKGTIVTSAGKEINDTSLLLNYNKVNRQLVITMDGQSFFTVDVNSISSFSVSTPEGQAVFYNKPEISRNNFVQLVYTGKNFNVYKKIITNIKTRPELMRQNGAYQSGGNYYAVRTVAQTETTSQGKYPSFVRINPVTNAPGANDSLVTGGKDYEIYARRTAEGAPGSLVYDYKADQTGTGDKYVRFEDVGVYYIVENNGGKNKVTAKFHLTKAAIDNAFGFYDADKSAQYISDHGNSPLDDNFVKGMAAYFNQ